MAAIEERTWTNKDGKSNTRYRVVYTVSGRRLRKDFETRKAAKAFAETIGQQREAAAGLPGRPTSKETFGAAVETFLEACGRGRDGRAPLEPLTVEEYRRRLKQHVVPLVGAGRFVADMTRDDIVAIRDKMLDSPLVRGTSKKHLALLKSVLRYALDRGKLVVDPTMRVLIRRDRREEMSKRERMPIHTREEVEAILGAAPSLGQRYEVMVNLLVFAGLRMSELRGLPVASFDAEKATIRISQRADMDGKIGSPKSVHSFRTVHLPERVVSLVSAWIEQRETHDLMFGTSGGKPIEHSNLSDRMWRRVQEKAAVRVLNPHSARHFFASYLIHQGVGLKVVQEALGHHDPAFTLRTYGHLFRNAGETAAVAMATLR